jgi:hypothetical protein
VELNHIHLYPQDVPAMQAWYAKVLGGVPGRARESRVWGRSIPWMCRVTWPSQERDQAAADGGRSLEHIGFDVRICRVLKRLEAMGIKPDVEIRPSNSPEAPRRVH